MHAQPEKPREDLREDRPDPEDPPTGPADELDDDFDPAAAPSNPDLVSGTETDEPQPDKPESADTMPPDPGRTSGDSEHT
jgi:hypothetical protein